ncbi:MAG: NAD-dependent epimerase/dehydratase family protein [Bacteroidia bacterium]
MILLTGATGFLGKYLVEELLSAGYSLRLLVRDAKKAAFQASPQLEIVEGEVNDVLALDKAFEGITYVVHAAALVSFNPKEKAKMMQVNVEGTANVVNLCLIHQVKKLVFMSSIAALGRAEGNALISEKTRWQEGSSNSNYAVSKRRAELEVYRGVEEGLNAIILNPGQIIGAGHWQQSTGKFYSIIHKGLSFYNRGINGVVGAADVAKAMRLVLEKEIKSGEKFILVTENMSQKDLFGQIALSIGKNPPKYELPPILAKIVGFTLEKWASLTGKSPIITQETIHTSLNQYFYDGSKITKTVAFQYTQMSEVIRAAGEQFKKEYSA